MSHSHPLPSTRPQLAIAAAAMLLAVAPAFAIQAPDGLKPDVLKNVGEQIRTAGALAEAAQFEAAEAILKKAIDSLG